MFWTALLASTLALAAPHGRSRPVVDGYGGGPHVSGGGFFALGDPTGAPSAVDPEAAYGKLTPNVSIGLTGVLQLRDRHLVLARADFGAMPWLTPDAGGVTAAMGGSLGYRYRIGGTQIDGIGRISGVLGADVGLATRDTRNLTSPSGTTTISTTGNLIRSFGPNLRLAGGVDIGAESRRVMVQGYAGLEFPAIHHDYLDASGNPSPVVGNNLVFGAEATVMFGQFSMGPKRGRGEGRGDKPPGKKGKGKGKKGRGGRGG